MEIYRIFHTSFQAVFANFADNFRNFLNRQNNADFRIHICKCKQARLVCNFFAKLIQIETSLFINRQNDRVFSLRSFQNRVMLNRACNYFTFANTAQCNIYRLCYARSYHNFRASRAKYFRDFMTSIFVIRAHISRN